MVFTSAEITTHLSFTCIVSKSGVNGNEMQFVSIQKCFSDIYIYIYTGGGEV